MIPMNDNSYSDNDFVLELLRTENINLKTYHIKKMNIMEHIFVILF